MIVLFIVALTVFLIAINGLYVAAEFATVSARKTRISQMAGMNHRLAQVLLPIMEDSKLLDRYVAACQIGITVSSLVLGSYGQQYVAPYLEGGVATLITFLPEGIISHSDQVINRMAQSVAATGVLVLFTILQVMMGELFPKSVAIQYPELVATATVYPMKWSLFLLRPLIWFFNGSGKIILRLIGYEGKDSHGHVHSPQEIEILVSESHEGGLLDDRERQMLRNAFRLRDLSAREVMIHRTRIVAAPIEMTVEQLMRILLDAGYSRMPLYQDSIDQIIGFIHIKDLFKLHVEKRDNLAEIMREVVYVPEMLSAVDVWETLRTKRQYMAVVFDEYGGTSGLITVEDLIEEIFGELQDEFDDEQAIIVTKKGRIHLRADVLVQDVNEYLGLNLPDDGAYTLSGLILAETKQAPVIGEEVTVGGVLIRVEQLADLGIREVSLELLDQDDVDSSAQRQRIHEWEGENE